VTTSPKHALGGEERECVPQVEAHLTPKFGERPCARPVSPEESIAHHIIHHLQVLRTVHLLSLEVYLIGSSYSVIFQRGCAKWAIAAALQKERT
jgi:hypothetical protein